MLSRSGCVFLGWKSSIFSSPDVSFWRWEDERISIHPDWEQVVIHASADYKAPCVPRRHLHSAETPPTHCVRESGFPLAPNMRRGGGGGGGVCVFHRCSFWGLVAATKDCLHCPRCQLRGRKQRRTVNVGRRIQMLSQRETVKNL